MDVTPIEGKICSTEEAGRIYQLENMAVLRVIPHQRDPAQPPPPDGGLKARLGRQLLSIPVSRDPVASGSGSVPNAALSGAEMSREQKLSGEHQTAVPPQGITGRPSKSSDCWTVLTSPVALRLLWHHSGPPIAFRQGGTIGGDDPGLTQLWWA